MQQGRPGAQVDASGSGAAQGRPGAQVDASGSGAAQGRPNAQVDASGSGAAQGRLDAQVRASSPGIAQGRMIDPFVASGMKDVRSDAVCQAEAQGQAHVGNASADPWGQYIPGGEAETFLTLGMPLGSQGLSSLQCERVEASSSDDSTVAVGRADVCKLHAQGDTPGGLIASESVVVPRFSTDPVPVGFRPPHSDTPSGNPVPVGFRPPHRDTPSGNPVPVGFRPHHSDTLNGNPGPLGFRPQAHLGPSHVDASICSLPLAALVCKAVRESGSVGHMVEADILVEDLPLCARPGGASNGRASRSGSGGAPQSVRTTTSNCFV